MATVGNIIAETFRRLVPAQAPPGTVLYARFLPPETLAEFAEHPPVITGWQVYVVSAALIGRPGSIVADRAVELREEKGPPVLLMVDSSSTGAGMDGIYSAAREITEEEFYRMAHGAALETMQGWRKVAEHAILQAKRMGAMLSPHRQLEFYAEAGEGPRAFGRALGGLGIWPVAFQTDPTLWEIDRAVKLTDYLLLNKRTRVSAVSRVQSLNLESASQEQLDRLTDVIRESDRRPFREITAGLREQEALWLGNIKPRLLDSAELTRIEIISWRSKTGKLTKWSGLMEPREAGLPVLPVAFEEGKVKTRLEVRWSVTPPDLPAHSVDYTVEVVSGEDVLASRRVAHTNKPIQKCILQGDDFEIEEGSKFEASIRVRAGNVEAQGQEEFLITSGLEQGETQNRKKSRQRTIVDGLIQFDRETFQEVVTHYGNAVYYERLKDGVAVRTRWGSSVAVEVSPLLRMVEEDLQHRGVAVGYWAIATFDDGRLAGGLEFIPLAIQDDGLGSRVAQATQQFLGRVYRTGPGLLAWVNSDRFDATEYLNAWIAALESYGTILAKAFTLEVRDLSRRAVGLIVLPFHPVRVAWKVAYDTLVAYGRYENVYEYRPWLATLKHVDGAGYPMFLPAGTDEAWVYGDMLDFHTVAMVSAQDPEPKTSVARMARAWFGDFAALNPETETSTILREQIRRFHDAHPDYDILHLHGIKVGDAGTVIAALSTEETDTEGSEESNASNKLRYQLDLFPGGKDDSILGAKISEVFQGLQTRGAIPESLRWMADLIDLGGYRRVRRFEWRKKHQPVPEDAAHLSVAFNIFHTELTTVPPASLPDSPYVVYGLVQPLYRAMERGEEPRWYLTVPPEYDGRKHPASGRHTDRLSKLQYLLASATVQNQGGKAGESWPALLSRLDSNGQVLLEALHKTSDWVIAFDRNIGFEYYDNPKEYPDVYPLYLIDCVPTSGGEKALQMVTSTIHVEEVLEVLGGLFQELGISADGGGLLGKPEEALAYLKAVSGRLAMRLSGRGVKPYEAVALAQFLARCRQHREEPWLPLEDGFLVPMDELSTFFPIQPRGGMFLFVSSPRRGTLEFRLVQVVFRRYLETARSVAVMEELGTRLGELHRGWEEFFDRKKPVEWRMLARFQATEMLQFYLEKARRHYLPDEPYRRLTRDIGTLAKDLDSAPVLELQRHRSYIFCPEHLGTKPVDLTAEGRTWLFGCKAETGVGRSTSTGDFASSADGDFRGASEGSASPKVEASDVIEPQIATVRLGTNPTEGPIEWGPSITGNPHLLVVGLPGMGKTTALANVAQQLVYSSILPVMFSYHGDIDQAARELWGDAVAMVDFHAIGFNPMAMVEPTAFGPAEAAGTLRDIFAAIFPDLGEIQLASIRDTIVDVYRDFGWSEQRSGEIPPFSAVWERLQRNPKMDAKVLIRLRELRDYGIFHSPEPQASLLNYSVPVVIRLHTSQNEVVQRAFAILILYHIYQEMFRRGVQARLTHVLVLDEAHRASRVKWLVRLAKESRKYGLAMVLASQEVKDFDESLVQAIGSYLVLRVGETDSKVMARFLGPADQTRALSDRLKRLPKFQAFFFTEGFRGPKWIQLRNPFGGGDI